MAENRDDRFSLYAVIVRSLEIGEELFDDAIGLPLGGSVGVLPGGDNRLYGEEGFDYISRCLSTYREIVEKCLADYVGAVGGSQTLIDDAEHVIGQLAELSGQVSRMKEEFQEDGEVVE